MSGLMKTGLLAGVLFLSSQVQAGDFDGIWKSNYDGLSMDIQDNRVRVYESSESFRFLTLVFDLNEDGTYSSGSTTQYVALEEGQLVFYNQRGEAFLELREVQSLPQLVTLSNDPLLSFDVFWEAFNENYSLFELTGTDWQAMRDTWRGSAAGAGSDELFDIFSSMIAPLNDRHTTISRPGETFRSGSERDPFWVGRESEFLLNIQDHYLGVPLQSRFADPRLRFGTLPGNIGYLAVSNFLDAANGREFGDTMDEILPELESTVGLVVDLRFNPGGANDNALQFLERLLSPGTEFVYAQQTRLSAPLPEDYTAPFLQTVTPRETGFSSRPIAVLTSHNSASGGDTVLLPMLYEPRIVQVGETSRGVFSKLLFRNLPNGWQVTLSNERHFSLEGVEYEQLGVPPALPVEQSAYDLDAGIDAGLDRAMAAILAQPAPVTTAFDIGAPISGLWFDPERDGEGWHIQRVSEQAVFVSFYSYDADDPDTGFWAVGLGIVEDGRVVVEDMVITEGGRFGAGPGDESAIEERRWGRAVFSFSSCNEGIAEVAGTDRFRGFVYRLQRLSTVPGLDCAGSTAGVVPGVAFDGAWLVAERPGEGWLVSHSANEQLVVTWYTFDEEGQPFWMIGLGTIDEQGRLQVPELLAGSGARYGWNFDSGHVNLEPVGSLLVTQSSCSHAEFQFLASGPGSLPVSFETTRLLYIEGVDYTDDCI